MATSGGTTGILLGDPTTIGTPDNTNVGGTEGAYISVAPALTGQCPNIPETFMALEEYWDYLQINEIAGYGIRNFPTTGVLGMGCGDYWDQSERHFLADAIAKAEKRMQADRWLGFPLRRKYEKPRQLEYANSIALGKYVRGCGVEANAYITTPILSLRTSGVINDPVTFTIAVSFTDINELIVCYPNTLCKIRPLSISIDNGLATVKIPRCRLLKPEFFKDYANDNERPNYVTDANFLARVDCYRNYLDTSTGNNLVWWRHTGSLCCTEGVIVCEPSSVCSDIKQLACVYITNQRLGFVQLEPATYNDGYSKATYAVRRQPDGVEVNFMRGYYDRYEEMGQDIKRAVIAWAHNNIPEKYCAKCELGNRFWREDNKPIEPPVRIGSGRSSWGNLYAENVIREFDSKQNGYKGGML